MNTDNGKLGRSSAGFAMAASITVLFSTALAWAKDAYKPLNSFMNALAWHNWITHGLADVVLFVGLGLIFSRTNWAERIAPNRDDYISGGGRGGGRPRAVRLVRGVLRRKMQSEAQTMGATLQVNETRFCPFAGRASRHLRPASCPLFPTCSRGLGNRSSPSGQLPSARTQTEIGNWDS